MVPLRVTLKFLHQHCDVMSHCVMQRVKAFSETGMYGTNYGLITTEKSLSGGMTLNTDKIRAALLTFLCLYEGFSQSY